MITIKKEVLENLKSNTQVKNRLAYDFIKTTRTIERWMEENDPMLTTAQALKTISEETGIPESDLISEAAA